MRNRGIITSAYLCFRTTDTSVPSTATSFFTRFDLIKVFYGLGSGLRQNLDWTDFKRMLIFIPPPAEQAAILRFLAWATGRLERAIRAKRKVIALLHEQKQAIIHRAVTRGLDPTVPLKDSGIPWLGEIPAHWEVRSFVRCTIEHADYRGRDARKSRIRRFLGHSEEYSKGMDRHESSREYVRASEYPKIMRRGLPKKGDVLSHDGSSTWSLCSDWIEKI